MSDQFFPNFATDPIEIFGDIFSKSDDSIVIVLLLSSNTENRPEAVSSNPELFVYIRKYLLWEEKEFVPFENFET